MSEAGTKEREPVQSVLGGGINLSVPGDEPARLHFGCIFRGPVFSTPSCSGIPALDSEVPTISGANFQPDASTPGKD